MRLIAATSGCFDLIHVGHVHMFKQMREKVGEDGSVVVLLNDDKYLCRTRRRIITPSEQRRELLLALRCVDIVITLEDDTPCRMIGLMQPHYWFKGPEYADKDIPELGTVESYGGETIFVTGGPLVHTTQILDRIRRV